MAIVVQCPSCGISSPAPESVGGRNVRCKKCGNPFVAQPTLDGSRSDTRKSQPAGAGDPFPTLPAEFGRYRVLRLLGKGGMGAVYLAKDSELRREVALKIPFFDAKESPQRVERFVREAQSAAALHHPNICTVYDAGRIAGTPFLTMAFIDGTPLDRAIDPESAMPQPRAAEIARKVALGLAHAHGKGIVHRDLKPANVVLTEDGEPVVMDFGLAKRGAGVDPNEGKRSRDGGAGDPNDAKITRVGGVLGTPSYMSPEQVRGDADVGPASDVYSLGVLLFEMLTGRTPYSGNMGAVMGQILAAPVPPLAETRPDADPRLDAICQRAMAKLPAARFGSMTEMAAALGEYLTAESAISVSLVEMGRPPAAVVPAPSSRPAPAPTAAPFDDLTGDDDAPRRTTKRKTTPTKGGWDGRRIGIAAGIALAVLVVGLLAAWAGGVFKVKTKEGTIELAGLPADAEVFVDGEKVTVSWDQGKQSAEVRVRPGTHKVEVKKDGFTAFGEDVTLEDKGRKVLTAKLTKPVAPAPPAVPEKPEVVELNPDRKAAEYVLSIGGIVRVNDEVDDIKTAAELPRKDFRLTYVDLLRNEKLRNAGLAAFDGCKNLKSLNLFHTPVRDEGLVHFKECKNLTLLNLGETQVGNSGVSAFKECKKLETLFLAGSQVDDEGLSHFAGCAGLKQLELGVTKVRGPGLVNFKDCLSLEFVELHGSDVTDEALAHLKGCKNLTAITFYMTRVGNLGLSHVADCRKLKIIGADDTPVTDEGLVYLKERTTLTKLVLDRTGVTDDGLVSLQGCAALEELWLAQTKVGDIGLARLKVCKNLRQIRLRQTNVTAAGVADLKKALPSCNIDWDGPPRVAVAPPTAPKAGVFVPLFNGKDLTGWKADPKYPGDWKVENGVLVGRGPGKHHLYSERGDYTDFHLKVDVRVNAGGNSGIYFRSSFGGIGPSGYEAQIYPTGKQQDAKTGSLLGGKAPSPVTTTAARAGEWFTLEVIAQGNRSRILINGKETADSTDPTYTRGHLALQVWDGDTPNVTKVEFRNIEIKELPAEKPADPKPLPKAGGFVPLFNGKDLTDCIVDGGVWVVDDGMLKTGSMIGAIRFRDLSTVDFHLRIEAKFIEGTKKVAVQFGRGFRCDLGGPETQLGTLHKNLGAFAGPLKEIQAPEVRAQVKPGEWYVCDLILKGGVVTVSIDGKQVLKCDKLPNAPLAGPVSLFSEGDLALWVRKIEVKEIGK